MVKNLLANAGDSGLIPGSERSPGERNGQPTLVFLPGKPHGQGGLAGYKSMGSQELDTTQRLNNNNRSMDDHVRTQQEDSQPQARKRGLRRNQIY